MTVIFTVLVRPLDRIGESTSPSYCFSAHFVPRFIPQGFHRHAQRKSKRKTSSKYIASSATFQTKPATTASSRLNRTTTQRPKHLPRRQSVGRSSACRGVRNSRCAHPRRRDRRRRRYLYKLPRSAVPLQRCRFFASNNVEKSEERAGCKHERIIEAERKSLPHHIESRCCQA